MPGAQGAHPKASMQLPAVSQLMVLTVGTVQTSFHVCGWHALGSVVQLEWKTVNSENPAFLTLKRRPQPLNEGGSLTV